MDFDFCASDLFFGGVAKWPKALVCKTNIRGFESHRRLFNIVLNLPRKIVLMDEIKPVTRTGKDPLRKIVLIDEMKPVVRTGKDLPT